uniref:ENTH domain-containing protein n=1 Tax=Romanomermis culicivorax TaxID=13658 RepID=A0A915I4T1_ROMCU
MAAITGHIPSLRRQIKNVACNYSDAQVKVREATSNDPWGASSSLMSEIADLTYNALAFTEIMQIVWKRLNDSGKNWRHVYKSLVLLDYLIKVGSEKVAHQCRENIFAIQTLKVTNHILNREDFQHVEDNKDQGMNVREKAKQLVAILKDDERLKNERAKALMARKRFVQNGGGLGSDGSAGIRKIDGCRSDTDLPSYGASIAGPSVQGKGNKLMSNALTTINSPMDIGEARPRRDSELDECRPTSAGEEELQLQIALALSKEEAEREQDARKSDDVRLQLALQQSEKDVKLIGGAINNQQQNDSAGQSTSAAVTRNTTVCLRSCLLLYKLRDEFVAAPSHLYLPFFGGTEQNGIDGTEPKFRFCWVRLKLAIGCSPQNFRPKSALDDLLSLQTAPSLQQYPSSAASDPWNAQQPPLVDNHFNFDGQMNVKIDPWGCPMEVPAPAATNVGQFTDHNNYAWLPKATEIPEANPTPVNNDSWGDNILAPSLVNQKEDHEVAVYNDRKSKTPDNFLGENSALVNLDNLLSGSTRSGSSAMYKGGSNNAPTNPFAPKTDNTPMNNPFAAQQKRATPTLNEMRNSSTNNQQQSFNNWAANGRQQSLTNPQLVILPPVENIRVKPHLCFTATVTAANKLHEAHTMSNLRPNTDVKSPTVVALKE